MFRYSPYENTEIMDCDANYLDARDYKQRYTFTHTVSTVGR